MNPTQTREEMCLRGLKMKLLTGFAMSLFAFASYGQVASTNGNFTATTPSNLSLQAGATPTTRLTILNSNGFVGINTTAPSDWLHVNGNVRANQFNTVNGIFNTTAAATNMSFNINGTNRMTLLATNGNFGIGTAAPADLLHVNGNVRANQFNTVNGIFNTTAAATNMSFNINGTNRMTLLATNGNFGIGTAAPADLLHVNGNLRGTQLNLTGGILNTTASTTDLSFRTNNTARMTILGYNGYVGIGTNSPANQLQIGPSPNGWGGNDLVVANGNGGLAIGTDATETYLVGTKDISIKPGNGVQSIYAKSDGNVGIGTTAPTEKLSIKQPGAAFALTDASITNTDYSTFKIWANNQNVFGLGVGAETKASYNPQLLFDGLNNSIIASGTLGIGTTTVNPAYKLDVNGTINATSILVNGQPISGGTSSWANIGTDINFLTGSVGIGKAPAAGNKLDVEGNVNSTGIFLNSNPGLGDPTFTTRSAGTKLVLNPSLATAAADYAFGTSANTLWSSVNTTSSSFKWFGGNTLAATLTGGGNLTLGGSGSIKARNVIPSSVNLTTAGATTTLTSASHYYQNSTVAQTIKLPVVTTLTNGHQFFIKNSSTQPVTVQTSAGTALQVMAANATLELTCINTAGGTGTASWQWVYNTNTAGGSGGSSQWVTTGSNISFGTGNVGIGTNSPVSELQVNSGPLKISLGRVPGQYSQALGWSNQFIGLNLARNSTGWIAHTDGANNGGSMLLGDIFGNLKVVNVPSSGASDQVLNESQINSNTKFVVNSNGNVGISGSLSVSTDIATNGNIEVGRGDNLDTKLRFHNHNQAWYSMGIDMSDAGKFKINSGGNIGDVAHFTMDGNGNVGIGTTNPTQKLTVKGTVYSTEVKVDLSAGAPDYVFEPTYDLKPLAEIETYIKENKHLPEVPSAKEMEANGLQLGEMNMLLLKKVEELTLHLIEQEAQIKKLRMSEVGSDLEKKLMELSNYIIKQESRIKELELKVK